MLRHVDASVNEASIDLTYTKQEVPPSISSETLSPKAIKREQSTQTDPSDLVDPAPVDLEVKVKVEPKSFTPAPVKTEENDLIESDHFDIRDDPVSDNSEDNMSLVCLKKKKKGRKPSTNGEVQKRGRKKKSKINDWDMLINSLPESTAVKLVDKAEETLPLNVMKTEVDFSFPDGTEVQVKKEPADMDAFQCCICFTQCFTRGDMLAHYKYVYFIFVLNSTYKSVKSS